MKIGTAIIINGLILSLTGLFILFYILQQVTSFNNSLSEDPFLSLFYNSYMNGLVPVFYIGLLTAIIGAMLIIAGALMNMKTEKRC